ncbi:MAG: S8 family serine peptidase [Verrucomicrobia bacterium]|nr:S8 family serine peptidase [Verrucomicrobiota bacterium]
MRLRFFVLFVVMLTTSRANTSTPAQPFSAKEVSQRYSDRVILAKPRTEHRVTTEAAESRERVRVREKLPRLGDLRIIEVEAGDSVDRAIARLQATGRYEFVERDYLETPDATPNDPNFNAQWSLNNTGQLTGSTVGADIKAVAAWDIVHDAPNVIVAVIDNGFNMTHRELVPNLWRNPSPTFGDINGASFIGGVRGTNLNDETGHGSHVAGIIGAAGNNGFNIAGVAWKVQLMALKNSGAAGTSSTSDSALCMDYAIAHGAQIINCSFGGTSFSQTFFTAIKAARDAGVIVVTSAGNDGLNNDTSPHYPSNYLLDNIVSVGNSGPTDTASASSDFGGLVDLFAPGTSISSLDLTATGQAVLSGTSMAAPHVTGTMALLKAQFPNDTYRQLINRLLRGGDRLTSLSGRAQTGARLNLLRALNSTVNRPFNDDFASRAVLSGTGASVRSNNIGATPETGEPAHAGGAASSTLWWQWTSTVNGTVSLTTTGSDYDTVLAVYTGTALATLTPVASNDNFGSLTTSVVTFPVTIGTTYQFAVSGKNGATGFTVLSFGIAPANDDFAGAVALETAESTQATGTTLHATQQTGEPAIPGVPGVSSVWYRWTAPRSGRFQVAAFSQVFDTALAIYTGSSVTSLQLVTSNDDTGVEGSNTDSLCTFQAVAGTTYSIKVDTKEPARAGAFVLSLTDSLWQFSGEGYSTGSVAVATDGTLYFGGGTPDVYLYAVKPDGTLKWRFDTGNSIDNCTPAVAADGTIYFGTTGGTVFAVAPDGKQRWRRALAAGNVGVSPAIGIDGAVYLHGSDGYLYALDPATGATRWRTFTEASTFASPVLAPDGTIYQVGSIGGVFALKPDGTMKWRFAVPSDSFSTPALDAAGNVYFTTYTTSRLYSVKPDGTLRWSFAATSGTLTSSSPVLSADGSTAYFGANNGVFHAIDTADGSLRWRVTLGGFVLASTAAVDAAGTIYVGAYDNCLYALNPTGTIKRSWDTGYSIRSSPTIIGRTLYAPSGDSKLYAIDIGAEAAGGTWTQYRQNSARTGRATGGDFAISAAPQTGTVVATQFGGLFVTATGTDPFTFQWSKDGKAIAGATNATLLFTATTAADAGSYTVAVTNGGKTLTPAPAVLTVDPLSSPRFAAFSVRAGPGADAQALALGFTVGPGTAKPVLIRAVGPSLAAFGLTGALADPLLQLSSGATVLAGNDNWGGDAAIATATLGAGAFPLDPASRDAAALRTLAPGAYAAQIVGAGTTTGIALGEVFDLDPVTSDAAAVGRSRLTNLSARGLIGSGNNILIAGFTIVGNVPKRVLIRAAGPMLTRLGLTGALADSVLEVYRGTTLLGRNDDWGGSANLTTAFAQANTFAFTPTTSFDSALILTLPAGVYTARVTGVGTGTGIALLEFYELP